MSIPAALKLEEIEQPIVFFDGICNLCNSWVNQLIRLDEKNEFLFAPLQGEYGGAMKKRFFNSSTPVPDSIILYYQGSIEVKASAVIAIAKHLGGVLKVFQIGRLLPQKMNNSIYDWVARNRYLFFGKKDSCMIPSPDLKSRFLP